MYMKRRRGASSKQRPNSKLTKKKSKACNRTFGSLTLLNKIIQVTFATQHSVRPVLLSERRRGPVSHRRLRRLRAVSLRLAPRRFPVVQRSRGHEPHYQGNRRTAHGRQQRQAQSNETTCSNRHGPGHGRNGRIGIPILSHRRSSAGGKKNLFSSRNFSIRLILKKSFASKLITEKLTGRL